MHEAASRAVRASGSCAVWLSTVPTAAVLHSHSPCQAAQGTARFIMQLASDVHPLQHPRVRCCLPLQEAAKQLKGVPLPASLSAHIYALQ